jgi:glycosyltransferase involved in cell wall biosynthesis
MTTQMTTQRPFFSIVIPTYCRTGPLAACLAAISRLDYPCSRFEVIVVDDGSKSPPGAVVEAFRDQFELRLLTQAHSGPAWARNTGVAHARGDMLAFIDDDCDPAADWLSILAARSASHPGHMIGGRVINGLTGNPYAEASQILSNLVCAHFNARPGRPAYFTTNNLAVPTRRFLEIGGFDGSFTTAEDRDLCDRWQCQGYPMSYSPEAVVYHRHALTLRSFWRQQFGYGQGTFRYYQLRAQRSSRHFRPNIQLYLRILSYSLLFEQEHLPRRLRHATLLAIAQVAVAAGFLSRLLSRLGT